MKNFLGFFTRFLSILYWSFARNTDSVKSRISYDTVDDNGQPIDPVFVLKRLWWAYADKKFTCAYIYPKDSAISKVFEDHGIDRETLKGLEHDIKRITEYMGERGKEWELVDFGDYDFMAIMTIDDLWMVHGALGENHAGIIRIVFSNFVDYRPGSEVAKMRKR